MSRSRAEDSDDGSFDSSSQNFALPGFLRSNFGEKEA